MSAPKIPEKGRKAPDTGQGSEKQPSSSTESGEKEAAGTSTAADRLAEIAAKKAEAVATAQAEAAEKRRVRVEALRTRLYPGGKITEALPPLKWLVRGWIAADFLGAIAAPPKAGKSFVALHFALAAAKGQAIHPSADTFARPLRVLYCAFEKPYAVRDRLEAYQQECGPVPAETFQLYAPRRPLALSNAEQLLDFAELVRSYAPELIFIDTLARVEGEYEENTVEGSRGIVEALDLIRGEAALYFVHHEGKDSAKGMRGSSNLLASVDIVLKVSGVPATGLEVSVTASNAAEAPLPLNYRVESALLPPAAGEDLKRQVGVLKATGRVEISAELGPRVLILLRDTFPEGATRAQLFRALEEEAAEGAKPYGEKSLGATLTQLARAGEIYKTGKGSATRWHSASEPEPLLDPREQF